MKSLLAVMVLATGLAWGGDRVLPAACGNDDVKVAVIVPIYRTMVPGLGPVPAGKARVILVQRVLPTKRIAAFSYPDFTVRLGLDGAWVGGAANSTYFVADVDPGKRHLCASAQRKGDDLAFALGVTLEAGQTYYFGYSVELIGYGGSGYYRASFSPMDQDQFAFLVSAGGLGRCVVRQQGGD